MLKVLCSFTANLVCFRITYALTESVYQDIYMLKGEECYKSPILQILAHLHKMHLLKVWASVSLVY